MQIGSIMKCLLPLLTALLTACSTLKPYEKEYLLAPVMDDAAVGHLKPSLMVTGAAPFEKLAASAGGGGESSSCPTCGG